MTSDKPQPYLLFAGKRGANYRHLRKIRDLGGLQGELFNASLPGWPSLRIQDWRAADPAELLRVHLARRRWHRPWLFKPIIRSLYFFLARCNARYRYCVCARRLRRRDYTAVVLWNGHRMPEAAVRQAAVNQGLRVVYIENGFLPDTRIADVQGVNALNSLPREAVFYRRQPLPAGRRDWQLSARHLHPSRLPDCMRQSRVLPERYLFAPFQVDDDTQIILHSPWIGDMQAYFYVLCRLRARLNSLGGEWADTAIVIKEHPTCPWDWERLHEEGERQGVWFANGNDTQALIKMSMGVLTINSSVGIEAMLFDKPAIILGNAFYALPELAQTARNEDELFAAVCNLGSWRLDTDLRDRFIEYLATHYCIRKPGKDIDDWPLLAAQIARLTQGTAPWL